MQTHRATCTFNYATTEADAPVEGIVTVYGKKSRRLFMVKWGDGSTTWEPEHLLRRDNCGHLIDEFWDATNLHRDTEFIPDPGNHPRCWVCGWASKSPKPGFLKAHLTRAKHHWTKQAKNRTHRAAKHAVEIKKTRSPTATQASSQVGGPPDLQLLAL